MISPFERGGPFCVAMFQNSTHKSIAKCVMEKITELAVHHEVSQFGHMFGNRLGWTLATLIEVKDLSVLCFRLKLMLTLSASLPIVALAHVKT